MDVGRFGEPSEEVPLAILVRSEGSPCRIRCFRFEGVSGSKPTSDKNLSTLFSCLSGRAAAGLGGEPDPAPGPPPWRKNQPPFETGGEEDNAIDRGRDGVCGAGSFCSANTTSDGPVLARFLREAPHFLPTDPMRDTSEFLPVLGGVGSIGGSFSDRVPAGAGETDRSGVTGRGGTSSLSSISKMSCSRRAGRDFFRSRLRSRVW